MVYANGIQYTGETNNKSQRHGQGTYTYSLGSTFTYSFGSTYTGEWQDGCLYLDCTLVPRHRQQHQQNHGARWRHLHQRVEGRRASPFTARMQTASEPAQVRKRLLIRRIFYGCTHHEIGLLCALRLLIQLFFRTQWRFGSALVYNVQHATLAQLAEQSLRK